MTDYGSNIGSSTTRRRIATAIAIVGAVFVGTRLANVWPRDVQVAYEVGPAVEELDVDYLQAGGPVKSVRFDRGAENEGVFRHIVRLQPGEYQVHITLYGQAGPAIEEVRGLSVPSRGATRFDLRDATTRSE